MNSSRPLPWLSLSPSRLGLGPLSRKTLWVLAGKVVQFLAWLLALAVLARRLEPEEFGLFQQGWLLVATLTPILLLGLPQGINYLLPRFSREQARQVVWLALALISIAALPIGALLAMFPGAASLVIGQSEIAPLAAVIVLVLLANLAGNFFEPVAIFKERQRLLMLFQTAYWAAFAAVAAALGRPGDLPLLFMALGALGLGRTVLTLAFIQRQFGLWDLRMDRSASRQLLRLAALLGPVAVIDILSLHIDKYVVSQWFDSAQFAVYFVGATEIPFVPLLMGAVTATLIPELSRRLGAADQATAMRILSRSIENLAWMILPLFGYLLAFGALWIPLVFTEVYRASVPVFLIFLCVLPLRVLNVHPLFIASGLQQHLLRGRLLDLGINFVGSIALIATPLGLLGPAVAFVCATLAQKAYQTWVIVERLHVPLREAYPWRAMARVLGWSLGAAVPARAMAQLAAPHLVGMIALGSLVYAGIMVFPLMRELRARGDGERE